MLTKSEDILRQELYKNFDSVVRSEIKKHNSAIDNNQMDIDSMKKKIESFKSDYDDLRRSYDSLSSSVASDFDKKKDAIENSFYSLKEFVFSSTKELHESLGYIKKVTNKVVTSDKFIEFSEQYKSMIEAESRKIEENFSCYKSIIEKTIQSNVSGFRQYSDETARIIKGFSDSLSSLESELNKFKIDASGVLKELNIYKKSMYIIEKKIENIYTLIERLQKKAETCHSKD